jgi:hypothetical protein
MSTDKRLAVDAALCGVFVVAGRSGKTDQVGSGRDCGAEVGVLARSLYSRILS